MDCKEFNKVFKETLSYRLISYFGDKMDTSKPMMERKFASYTLYTTIMNSIPSILSDGTIIGYKLSDSNDFIIRDGIVAEEQKRLLNDITTCPNIILFLSDYLYFK